METEVNLFYQELVYDDTSRNYVLVLQLRRLQV